MRLPANDDFGKLILRVITGATVLFHGFDKITHGLGGIEGLLASRGLPGFIAYGVLIGEVVAPVLIIAGFYSRLAALVLAFNMVVAVALAHVGDITALTEHGGWAVEVQAFMLFNSIAIMLLGPGRYAVNDR